MASGEIGSNLYKSLPHRSVISMDSSKELMLDLLMVNLWFPCTRYSPQLPTRNGGCCSTHPELNTSAARFRLLHCNHLHTCYRAYRILLKQFNIAGGTWVSWVLQKGKVSKMIIYRLQHGLGVLLGAGVGDPVGWVVVGLVVGCIKQIIRSILSDFIREKTINR